MWEPVFGLPFRLRKDPGKRSSNAWPPLPWSGGETKAVLGENDQSAGAPTIYSHIIPSFAKLQDDADILDLVFLNEAKRSQAVLEIERLGRIRVPRFHPGKIFLRLRIS